MQNPLFRHFVSMIAEEFKFAPLRTEEILYSVWIIFSLWSFFPYSVLCFIKYYVTIFAAELLNKVKRFYFVNASFLFLVNILFRGADVTSAFEMKFSCWLY